MSICAVIIAKDEAHVIERCIASVAPLADAVLLCDTGSTDDTILKAGRLGARVMQEPWRNFSYNRNVALDWARREGFEFAITIDADDVLKYTEGYTLPAEHDLYDFEVHHGAFRFHQQHLIRLSKPFHFRGVTHEFLDCAEPFTRDIAQGIVYSIGNDGARRASGKKPSDDAYLLQQALTSGDEPDIAPRYTFYLAQSLRDDGKLEGAMNTYLRRATLGGWKGEVFYSRYQAGLLAERLKQSALHHHLAAMDLCPDRMEPYWAATRLLNRTSNYRAAWTFARAGILMPMPKTGLFVETWIYRYGMLDEYSIAAQRCGAKEVARKACETLLRMKLPYGYEDRIRANMAFCV